MDNIKEDGNGCLLMLGALLFALSYFGMLYYISTMF